MARKPPEGALSAAWKSFYATPEGRMAIAHIFAEFHIYSPIHGRDPVEIATANGERNVALRIAQLLALKPERFAETATEDIDLVDRLIR